MELSNSFSHEGWTIKYALSSSQPSSQQQQQQPGKPILFIHGTPWSSAVFQPLAAALTSKNYRVLLYDLPGYGASQALDTAAATTKPEDKLFEGETSVAAQARALTALLKHLDLDGKAGNEKPAVIAHDIAGAVAFRAHLLRGVEFESLLLMDTNCVLPWGDGFYQLVRSEPQTFLRLPLPVFEAVVRAVVRSACFNPAKLDAEMEDALAAPWIGSEGAKTAFVRQIAQADDADVAEMLDGRMYQDVRCRVKILWGEGDEWIPRGKVEELRGMLGERVEEFVVVPDAGHLVMVDQPERVGVEVFDWLGKSW